MSEDLEPRTRQLIADLWKRNQPLILERLDALDDAAAALQAGTLDEPQRAAAEGIAHKLSGSLGMFGYQQGTLFARDLESELRSKTPDPNHFAELTVSLRASLFPSTD